MFIALAGARRFHVALAEAAIEPMVAMGNADSGVGPGCLLLWFAAVSTEPVAILLAAVSFSQLARLRTGFLKSRPPLLG